MKLAILSDTHFGDLSCGLVQRNADTGIIGPGPLFPAFLEAVGTGNDYLVLAGDIFDFSVASYDLAYRFARVFFGLLKREGVAQEIIYLPGNHDADMWHIVQHQRAVINRVQRGLLPKSFAHSTPAILLDKVDHKDQNGLYLHGVKAANRPGTSRYGRMFLDGITGSGPGQGTVFNFAYPNLYLITDHDKLLVTHGQYLEPVWSFLGEVVQEVAPGTLQGKEMAIEEMMALNFPVNQLLCTGVGQAGLLTERLVRPLEGEVKKGDFVALAGYLTRLEGLADRKLVSHGWLSWLEELATDQILGEVRRKVQEAVEGIKGTRYRKEFATDPAVQRRFRRYYRACIQEVAAINDAGLGVPGLGPLVEAPSCVLFGHTHDPIPWKAVDGPTLTLGGGSGTPIPLYNSGGWLQEGGMGGGAEVFCYETGQGLSSTRVA